MQRNSFTEYFSFNRKERTGIIVVLVLIVLFTLLPFLFPFLIPKKATDNTAFEKQIAELKYELADSVQRQTHYGSAVNSYPHYYPSNKKRDSSERFSGELFYFDPNTLTTAGWKKLGLKDKTIITIQHYLAKGGKFKQPGDISNIWGLHEDEVKRLIPYIEIKQPSPPSYTENKHVESNPVYKTKYSTKPVEINTADTTSFIELPGIGNKLANRIVNFREKLGGFYKVEQVAETFALPDSTYQKIKSRLVLDNPSVKKININTATVEELKAHPYIRYGLANAIIQYRAQHGKFLTASDIKKIMMVTDEIYNKLIPYLSVE